MTRFEVVLKDGRGSTFEASADPVHATKFTLDSLADGQAFIAWATTAGTAFIVAKDQIAVIVVNAPERKV